MALVEFPLEGGGTILVEVDRQDGGGSVLRGGRGSDTLERAASTFEAAMGTIRVVAHGVLVQLSDLARSPDEVHISFGLELNAKAGAVLASAESVAQLQVDLTWRPRAASPAPGETGAARAVHDGAAPGPAPAGRP